MRGAAVILALLAAPLARADAYDDALKFARDGQHDKALAVLDTALARSAADPRLRFLKSLTLHRLQRIDDAQATLTALTQDYPELAEPYNNLAVLHAAQGRFEQARAALETALRLNPDYAVALENLGDVYARLAGQAYARALQLDPGNATLAPKQTTLSKVLAAGMPPQAADHRSVFNPGKAP